MGAPVGIALIAGIAIPAMMFGIPVYVGRKVRCQRNVKLMDKMNQLSGCKFAW